MAYRVAAEDAETVAAYLRERELDHYPVYRECTVDIALQDGRTVSATTYLPRPDHPDFLPDLSLDAQLAIIRQASGVSGSNIDYVRHAARDPARPGHRRAGDFRGGGGAETTGADTIDNVAQIMTMARNPCQTPFAR